MAMRNIALLIAIVLLSGTVAYAGVESNAEKISEELGGGGSVAFAEETPLDSDASVELSVTLRASHDEVETGVVVTWTASASDETEIDLYEWDLDGDGTFETATGGATVSRALNEDGSIGIRVRVTDGTGATAASEIVEVVVLNREPTAAFTVERDAGNDTGAVAFRDASDDLDGEIVEWEWTFGDGATSRSQNPVHAYANEGEYAVGLIVTDDDGEASAAFSRTVLVENSAPVAAFASPAAAIVGTSIAFVDESEDPSPNGSIVHVAWDFGDGSFRAGGPAGDGVYVHTYADPGTYTVTLYVIDDDGAMSSVRRTVSVVT
jgi:PKD repeat protein